MNIGSRREARVLIVGVGGIGCPLALILARAGVGTLGLVDDDQVERTNLHRQILFREGDVGRDKLDAAADGLARLAARPGMPATRLELHRTRFVPETATALARDYDLVLEGADNFPTKFLVSDVTRALGRPAVHAAALRTVGTVFAVAPHGAPCYRCIFEDVPSGDEAPTCADAGVMGPLLGLVAAFQAELALAIVDRGDAMDRYGEFVQLDVTNFEPRTRRRTFQPRAGCPGCGSVSDHQEKSEAS